MKLVKCQSCGGRGVSLYGREVEDGCDECEATGMVETSESTSPVNAHAKCWSSYQNYGHAFNTCASISRRLKCRRGKAIQR